jgi:hypothetical protein
VEAVGAGALVELGGEVAFGCEHDRFEAAVTVGLPCGEQLLCCCGGVTDVHAAAVEVEAERFRSAITKGEGGSGLCLIIKPVGSGVSGRCWRCRHCWRRTVHPGLGVRQRFRPSIRTWGQIGSPAAFASRPESQSPTLSRATQSLMYQSGTA